MANNNQYNQFNNYPPTKMRHIYNNWAFSLACFIIAATTLSSCDLSTPPDPEFPLYVTYTISASEDTYTGPDQLLLDIKSWIDENQIVYDEKANYTTGDASEFATTDAAAIKKYEEEFVPKFTAYLEQAKGKLSSGTYGSAATVNATFQVYASRAQGEGRNLKYDIITFVYPSSSAQ